MVVPLLAAVAVLSSLLLLVGALYYLFQPAILAARCSDGGAIEEDLSGGGGAGVDGGGITIVDRGSVPLLSLIVPAYNEEERLPSMLDDTADYLTKNRGDIASKCGSIVYGKGGEEKSVVAAAGRKGGAAPFEIIVVDDGSNDGTADVARRYAARRMTEAASSSSSSSQNGGGRSCIAFRLVRLRRNGGKGAAVRAGMMRSRGELCLMVDADGATDLADGLTKVLDEMGGLLRRTGGRGELSNGYGGGVGDCDGDGDYPPPPAAVFGSRAHLEESSVAERSPIRTFLMHAFHFFVRTLCSSRIRDTQCGFKLFTRAAAASLFGNLHLRRWAFDTELVAVAEMLEVPLAEVGVRWHEVDGSKLDTDRLTLALVSMGMLRDMLCVRACYALGVWRVER